MCRIFLVASLALIVSCSGDDPGPSKSPRLPGDGVQPGEIDLDLGTWNHENVSNTVGTISHDGALAFTSDGTAWIAWAEPEADNLSDQNIWAGRRGGGVWSNEARTSDTDVQNAFPWLVAQGNDVHLVYSGYPGGDNDVFYTKNNGYGWGPSVDLTSGAETSPLREDYKPKIAVGPAGQLAVAYLSAPLDAGGNPVGALEVRVIRFTDPSSPQAPETVIPQATNSNCDDPTLVFDAQGKLHVVASCGEFNHEKIRHATDASGSWDDVEIPHGTSIVGWSPALTTGGDRSTLHLAWTGYVPCSGGTCLNVLYSRGAAGTFASSVTVTTDVDSGGAAPVIGVDDKARVLIGFHRLNGDNMADIFFSWSADGVAFAPERCITQNTPESDEWMPWALAIDPIQGVPHLTYVKILSNTEPLNTEIVHAWLVPAGG